MSEQTQYHDITPAQFEYELRDHRRMAYNEYLRFKTERDRRNAAFEQTQARRCPLSRRFHAIVHNFRERHDAIRERELLQECQQGNG